MRYEIQLPCNIALYGCTRSGKTWLAMRLLREQLLKQTDVLLILSTTADLSGDFREFRENRDPKNGRVVQRFTDPAQFKRVIEEVVSESERLHRHHDKPEIPSTLVVLDDCIGQPILRFKGLLDSLSTRNRHLKISFMVLCQRIAAVPRTFRINTRVVVLFNCSNLSELERMLDEYTPKRYRALVRDALPEIYNVEYNFILADTFATRQRERLWLNGDELLLDYLDESD